MKIKEFMKEFGDMCFDEVEHSEDYSTADIWFELDDKFPKALKNYNDRLNKKLKEKFKIRHFVSDDVWNFDLFVSFKKEILPKVEEL